MKRFLTFGLLVLLGAGAMAQGPIILTGNYQGKNIYVQNPFAGAGVGFCVYEVTVNGDITTDEISSSAFEIDFTNFALEIGDEVEVQIKHKSDCRPKVLNPEVLKPKSTFEIVTIEVSEDGVLEWRANSETGKLTYVVEQFRWSKWIKIGEVDGVGTEGDHDYTFDVSQHLHAGENKFRVKQTDYTGKPRTSQADTYSDPSIPEVDFQPRKVKDEIAFTADEVSVSTLYEIYDAFGNIVKKGFDSVVDCSSLPKGAYYLNYGNKTEQFVKTKDAE